MKRPPLPPILSLNGVPTAEVLAGRKDVHCKITKEEFVRCKVKLWPHGISMGRMMSWLIKQVAEEDPRALSLIEDLVKEVIASKLAGHRSSMNNKQKEWYDELDQATLYGLIDDAINPEKNVDD